MSEVKKGPDGCWSRLVKAMEEQGALLETMKEATEEALAAAKESDWGRLEEKLEQREVLMRQVENVQVRELELRPRLGKELAPDWERELEAAEGRMWLRLEETIGLNDELEEELAQLRRRLDRERVQLGKLRRTTAGYKPKEMVGEGLFVDRRS